MITSLQLTDFKNFADETLRAGPFTVIIGANASGKSNIRDAFRFLHGVGRGYSLADIIGGRYGAGGQREWEPIRGGNEIIRFGRTSFSLTVGMGEIRYHIKVGVDKARSAAFRVIGESLESGERTIYTTHPGEGDPVHAQSDDALLSIRMDKTGNQRKLGYRVNVRPDQPALTQIPESHYVARAHKGIAETVIENLARIRFLDLSPDRMRQPSFPGQTTLGDGGENLPSVLKEICEDESRKRDLASWIRDLTPMDARDFEFPADPITARAQLVIREGNGRAVSAYGASDGTLRFIATLAALLGENPAGFYFFEEIDNGIHPARVSLLVDFLERQTAKCDTQVITTTHSPDMLTLVNDTTFESAAIVYRDENSEDGIVRPVSELPNVRDLRKSSGLGRLHSIGWMEDALAFSGGNTA